MSTENVDEHKTNDDYAGMEESLVPDLDTITARRNAVPTDVSIQVCSPIIKEEKFTKHVVYTIKGTDREGGFEVVRRYKDFDRIRETLVKRWPGCYVPPLPPKSVTSNMDTKFIEDRRRQLQTFLKKIGELPYLHYSEEHQIFIRSGNPDIEKALAHLQKVAYEDLIQKYSTSFNYLSGKELNNETVMKIAAFKVFLQKTQGHFSNFKKIARSVSHARRTFYEQFANFHNQVCVEYEKNVFSEYHNHSNGKNVFDDPSNFVLIERVDRIKGAATQPSLEYLYEWIKAESREIEAFIEAIDQRDKYESYKAKTFDKQKSDTSELQKVLAGKTTLKGIFSRKSKAEEVESLERHIAQAGKDIESLTMIHDMVTLIIAYSEIEKFKSNKLEQYYYIIKLAATNELTNVRNMIDYWNMVAKNENIRPPGEN